MNDNNKRFLINTINLIKRSGSSDEEILACAKAQLNIHEPRQKIVPKSEKASPYRGDDGYCIEVYPTQKDNKKQRRSAAYQGGMP